MITLSFVRGTAFIQIAMLSDQVAKNSDPPTPSLLACCGASQKILNKVFLFCLINICFSFKQLYNSLTELKYVCLSGAK